MWIKKSTTELAFERKHRIKIAKYYLVLCIGLYLYWFNIQVGTIDNFMELYYSNPEYSSSFVLIPIFIYAGYNGYINHGSLHWTTDRVCVGCNKTWYHGNDGWGFMSFGHNKKKWYQIKACKTPGKCNIVGKHQVRWVSDKD